MYAWFVVRGSREGHAHAVVQKWKEQISDYNTNLNSDKWTGVDIGISTNFFAKIQKLKLFDFVDTGANDWCLFAIWYNWSSSSVSSALLIGDGDDSDCH